VGAGAIIAINVRWAVLLFIIAAGCAAATLNLTPPPGFQPVPFHPDNPPFPEKIALGAKLFRDPLLSADRTVACANCHRPDYSFTVPERFGRGIGGVLTTRRPSVLLNRAYGAYQFWDGRAASLEDLVLLPIQHPQEMALALPDMEARLRGHAGYSAEFQRVFEREPNSADVARALTVFLRTLVSQPSPFTRYLAGDGNALTESAQRGQELFRGKARCSTCHWEPNFTDEEFHNTGVAARQAVFDKGRSGGAFKTPTLHNVSRHPPYMHDGSLATLEDVVDYYDRGGHPHPRLEVRPIGLTPEEKADLLALLKSL